ncbi:MAG TPA: AraC family transcriptional regulator, partial [Solirubrobacteraceae bacterium]
MLIHVMRAWLRLQEDDATDGWLLALRDPVVAGAMDAIHQRPGEAWSVESLAREVSVSRATLARRFVHLIGETPPQYLTRWRMDIAAQRLRDYSAAPTADWLPRSLFSGTNLLAVNIAPCGSAITVRRVHGASNGGTRTLPPSRAAVSAVASASSVPKVTLQWAGTS